MTRFASMPTLYIPHGGGPAFFMQGGMREMFQPMADFLSSINDFLPAKPTAILLVSAHWETVEVTLTSGARPQLIYDYYGFPEDTYSLTYPAPGCPGLAARAAGLLADAGIDCALDAQHGWDHGVFIPLKVIYPDAGIPVVAMSLQSDMAPAAHIAIGRALAPLRDDGILLIGSGMSYHNLNQFADAPVASSRFDNWLDMALAGSAAHRAEHLARWSRAPCARLAHPREEHLLPLMVASGAGSDLPATRIWEGSVGGSRISSWAFS